MTRGNAAGVAIRAGTIVALAALGGAIALIVWQERLAGAGFVADPVTLPAIGTYLRIAILLLLVSLASVLLVAVLVVRVLAAAEPAPEAEGAIGEDAAEPAGGSAMQTAALPAPLAQMGHLMAVGGLIRAFCHELNNELSPVHGYAELLCSDARLSEPHRRQAARIRDAAKTALADIRSFGAALGWSSDPGQVTRLAAIAAEAARSAQAAMAPRIELDVPAGADIEVTATESQVGQAVLHLCAAVMPLFGKQDARIRIRIDSIVGAASATAEDVTIGAHRLEIWSDPVDPERTRVQFGTLRPSRRYGRLRFEFEGQGWTRELAGRMFEPDWPDDAVTDVAAMSLVGRLMIDTGGAITIDTCPDKQTTAVLLWPARIAPEIGAPLELDAREDELDALVIHASEATAEQLSRRLTGLGLRVAATTSPDAAAELVAEMGARCRAIVLAQSGNRAFVDRLRQGPAKIFEFEEPPKPEELERLAIELRRGEGVT